MNTRSLGFRLIAWYAGLLVVLGLAFGAYSYWRLEHYISTYWTEVLSDRARRITTMLSDYPYVRNEIEARYAPESNDWFIRVTREDGSVVYVSGEPNNQSFTPAKVPWPSKEFSVVHTGVRQAGNAGLLIATVPFVAGNEKYLVEAGVSALPMQRIQQSFLVTLLIGLPVVVAVAIWGGFWLIKWALAPVQKITSTAQEITLQRLNKRLPVVDTGDEVASLSKTLNQMISRLEESFQTVKRFTADASHELQTPLTILRGELETLLLDESLSKNVREAVFSLIEEVERLSKIVRSLLVLSRLDAGQLQTERVKLNLSDLVETTADQMSPLAGEKNITLSSSAGEEVAVHGDHVGLKQLVVNLLDNAIKYTPEGGRITVGVNASEQHVYLEIADTGPGIPESDLPHVFDRFFRADSVRHETAGAGLGLSIVQSICAAHGGLVRAENHSSGGCRITVQLPLAT
jgi:heavy metal sensor kinase